VVDDFTRMRNQGDLDLQTTLERICYEDRRIVETTRNGVPHKVLRGNMIVVSKLWMTFILTNLQPKFHPSDLLLEECHLLGCIKTPGITVDPARIISDMIWANLHTGGSKQSLAFLSLITSLCEDAGIPVVRSQKIREPIDKKYFRNHCADGDPNAPPAPPPQVPPRTMEDL
jgi:hypothetical protein